MTTLAQARRIALALPDTTEEDHHGIPSWRVKGKIFATVPDPGHVRVMLEQEEIRAAVAENSGFCAEVYWGARLACVVVDIRAAPTHLVREFLNEAWYRKAPRRLAQEVKAGPGAPAV